MTFDLRLEFVLSAPAHRVMQLLTDPTLIRKWSGEDAVVVLEEGGRFSMFDGWATGTVLKATETELCYTWHIADWNAEIPATTVHYTLKNGDGGTVVTVNHTGFLTEDEMKNHRNGWVDYFFDPLEDYIMIFEQKK